MKNNILNLIGTKIGRWTIKELVDRIPSDPYHHRFKCICDCGTELDIPANRLTSNKRRIWGCKKCYNVNANPRKGGYLNICGSYWERVTRSAKNRNIPISINIEYANKILEHQNFLCALSGLTLVPPIKRKDSNTTASLDRINPNEGYVEGNIQWIHKDINYMKNKYSDDRFIEVCILVHVKSIGMLEKNEESNILIPTQPFNALWKRLLLTSPHRKIQVFTSDEYIKELLVKQGFRCNLSNLPINPPLTVQDFKKNNFTTSLDRIDSSRDYENGNLQWVHKDVNRMKMDYDQGYYINICKLVAENHFRKS